MSKWDKNVTNFTSIPRRSTSFRCLLFMPITRLLDWELNQAREWVVSDRPSSATGRASSTGVDAAGCWCETLGTILVLLSPWCGHLSTSHKSTEWSALYLSRPAAIRLESTGFHATVLHCLACRGTGIKIQDSICQYKNNTNRCSFTMPIPKSIQNSVMEDKHPIITQKTGKN